MRSYLMKVLAGATTVGLAAALIACDNRTLRVTAPDQVQPNALNNATALPTVTAAVYADFSYSYAGDGGDDEGIIQFGGLLGDEWHSSDTFPTRNEVDQRQTNNSNANNDTQFRRLHRARNTAEFAVGQYQKFQPNAALEAEAFIYAGYAILELGENYCSGIEFSQENADGTINYGLPLTTAQVWGLAHTKFDSALAVLAKDTIGADVTQIPIEKSFAAVGIGRMLVDSGAYAAAATAVAAVPDGFVFLENYSAAITRTNNGVFEFTDNERRYSIPNEEGVNGLPYHNGDPRLPIDSIDPTTHKQYVGFDRSTAYFQQDKYPSPGSAIPLATDMEARLIEAEAAIAAGSPATALVKIQQAREDAAAEMNIKLDTVVTAVPVGMTLVQFLFQERAYDLWLTGHRLGDLRRLIRQYGFAANSVFPTGPYPKGGVYGNEVALPIPISELGNPNYKACDATQP
jgi:starch-binding outer membrane protein, SusD/RagB family